MIGFQIDTLFAREERPICQATGSNMDSISRRPISLLLESVNEHAIFILDLEGRVSSWHVGAERIKGYRKEEILGQHYSRFYTPEDIASGKPAKQLETALRTGRVQSEGWRVLKDGSRFYADVVITTVKDDMGIVLGFCKVTRDMTERKMAEEALKSANDLLESRVLERTAQLNELNDELKKEIAERKLTEAAHRESENRFRMMADTMPALVWMSGTDGQVNFFNKGWLDFTGQSGESMLNNGWMKWIHPEDLTLFVKAYDDALKENKIFTAEYRFRRFDGEYRWVLNTGVPRFTPEGSFMGFTGSIFDITNRKKAEEVLSKSEMHQREFVANVSHDFRTPVATIKGFAETLRRGALYDSKNALDFVKIIEKHAERLETLIEDLLNISTLESGKIRVQNEAIPLNPYITEMVKSMTFIITKKNISVKISIDPDIHLWADPSQLHTIIQNLFTNAVKYNRRGGWVEISAEVSGGNVKISIKDNGIGISDKHLPRIFDRFYRVDRNHPREAGDTGLGLHIVKQIVESSGGDISVESEENVGSTFSFTLPLNWPTNGFTEHDRNLDRKLAHGFHENPDH